MHIASLALAKKTIAEAVCQIRQNCRGDEILRQYNIEFGFCRNYLGAGVWSSMFIICVGVANIFCSWLSWWAIGGALIIQMLLMVACYLLLETRGWTYAKYLFEIFTN